MTDAESRRTVAIIGAGIAGLSCARILSDQGFKVTVFEKSRGPGGRMSTRRGEVPAAPDGRGTTAPVSRWQCDHGAQYFTARDPAFMSQITAWLKAGVVAPWDANVCSIGAKPPALPPGSSDTVRYVGTPGMTAPAQSLADGLQLVSNTCITGIQRSIDGWVLSTEGSTDVTAPFHFLVLAIPAQQAGALLLTATAKHPAAMAPLLQYCHEFALQPCWALMLHFQQPVVCAFDAAFINRTPGQEHSISWVARDSAKPGRRSPSTLAPAEDTWLVHATAQWSAQHLDCNEQQIADDLLPAFRAATGIVAEPVAISAHRWRYAQTGDAVDYPGYLLSTELNIGLCGDWLNKGRVEGAWLSGRHLAHHWLSFCGHMLTD